MSRLNAFERAYDYASKVMTENMLDGEALQASAFLEKKRAKVADLTLPQYPDALIKSILRSVKTIAMVGASANDIRPSYFATQCLSAQQDKVIPVNQRDGQGDAGPERSMPRSRMCRHPSTRSTVPARQI